MTKPDQPFADDCLISLDPARSAGRVSDLLYGVCMEDVNHELYGGIWSQMIFGENFEEAGVPVGDDGSQADGPGQAVPSESKKVTGCVSGMWRGAAEGDIIGHFSVISDGLRSGRKAQQMGIRSGSGRLLICNMGLNRGGMGFVAGKDYNGYLYARAQSAITVYTALESADGSRRYAEASFSVQGGYQKYPFTLIPDGTDRAGRFVIEIRQTGTLDVGYAFLEPGDWGLYKGLHVRRDVGQMLENQGLTVLRFGGCMANAADYKWKKMTGASEERGGYKGWWYEHASYGFGIIEFMDLCEALGKAYVPDFSSYESADDMGDFLRFACGNDPSDPWVGLRMRMGREKPYNLQYLQIGNEEKIDTAFAGRFNAIADRIWAIRPDLTLIVGDFEYQEIVEDPDHFTGNPSKITSLAGHRQILDHAVKKGGRVWFDIHFWSSSGTDPVRYFEPTLSFYAALKKICPEADTGLCVLELNANCHTFERALCNAFAIHFARRHSDVIHIMCSANALQVQGHNDNDWNQGLVFMDTAGVWYQPPAYIDRMLLDGHQPCLLETGMPDTDTLSACAVMSEDKKTVCVSIVNRTGREKTVGIDLHAFGAGAVQMRETVYADGPAAVNTPARPEGSRPSASVVTGNAPSDGRIGITVGEYSLTVIAFNWVQA